MHRCLFLLSLANIVICFCCGCSCSSKPSAQELAVTPVSTTKLPVPITVHGKAKVSIASEEAIPFTLVLPPGWTWTDGQAEKIIGPPLTVLVSVTARELPDDEQRERPAAAARRRLQEVGDERKSEELDVGAKLVVRDRRIIQVGDNDAVWDVVTFHVEGETQPTRLEARCHLKLGHREITIDGSRIDSRPDRTAADFDDSQAEFLKIIQSFRLDPTAASPRP